MATMHNHYQMDAPWEAQVLWDIILISSWETQMTIPKRGKYESSISIKDERLNYVQRLCKLDRATLALSTAMKWGSMHSCDQDTLYNIFTNKTYLPIS